MTEKHEEVTETEGVTVENEAPVAEEQGEEAQVATEKTNNQELNWRKANETMAEQSARIRQLSEELSRLQSPPVKEEDFFSGRDDDDILTVADFKKALSRKEKEYNQQIAELSARSRRPDFEEVTTKYGKLLPDAVKQAILHAPNPYDALYEACKGSLEYYKDQISSQQHSDAARAAENLKKPGNASGVGGSGALSKASLYENMGLDEIRALSYRYASGN